MGYATDYLQSTRMAQDLVQIMGSTKPDTLEYANKTLTCAILRWQQWFENPYVDSTAIKLQQATDSDFNHYRQDIMHLLTKNLLNETQIQPLINQILLTHAQRLMTPGSDFQTRMVKLITMGACEYHGFNAAFAESIQRNGLNPSAKFSTEKQFEQINKIFKRVGRPLNMERAKYDQNKVYVTPDPYAAYYYAEISPEWFYFFSNSNNSNFCRYSQQNYQAVRNNLFKFPGHEKLTIQDNEKITNFFKEWWSKLATPSNAKIAMMPMYRNQTELQNKINFNLKFAEKLGYEKLLEGQMYTGYEHIYDQPIAPEFLQIIDLPSTEIHCQRLTKLKNDFQHADQALKTQAKIIANLTLPNSEPEKTI